MAIQRGIRRREKGERALIAAIRERARPERSKSRILRLGIGDDCALLRPRRGEDLAVTTDLTLEQVHFRRDWHPPESVGHRSLARGLSDLAAMGAWPEAAFLSLAVPEDLRGQWFERFLDGFLLLARKYKLPLAGGDLAESPSSGGTGRKGLVAADIMLVGSVPSGKALLRSGARAGDKIYVSGEMGGAAAELRALGKRPAAFRTKDRARHPHLYPDPRLALGRKLLEARLATAAIDVSDGLSTDLAHICEESGLAAIVNEEAIPVDPDPILAAKLEDALHGGEDYELLFTARPGTVMPRRLAGVAVHEIGRMTARRSAGTPGRGSGALIELCGAGGKRIPLASRGWEHFHS